MAGKVDSSEFQRNLINTQICAFLNLCAKKAAPYRAAFVYMYHIVYSEG